MSTVHTGRYHPYHHARKFEGPLLKNESLKKIHASSPILTYTEATNLCTHIVLDMKEEKEIRNEICRKVRDAYFGKKFPRYDLHPLSNRQLAIIISRNE